MTDSLRTRVFTAAVLVALLLAVVLVPWKGPAIAVVTLLALAGACVLAGSAACAQDGVFGGVLKNLGLGSNDPIEYRERPPLVG